MTSNQPSGAVSFHRHKLIIVCGNAGVGKTTFGLQLAATYRACLLDIDTVSEPLVRAGLTEMGMDANDRDSTGYKTIYRHAIHETLFDIAAQNLEHLCCIIVAPFTQERRDPSFLGACAVRVRAPVRIYYLRCNEATRRARIHARNNPRDASKLNDWDAYSAIGSDNGVPPFPHTLIETD